MTFDELLVLVSSGVPKRDKGRLGTPNDAPRLCADSRLVKAGDIFVAMKGSVYDGHYFIGQALDRGAKYIVCQHGRRRKKYEIIIVDDSAKAAAFLAQAGRGNPASKLTNLAVTGTNGKTTVAFLVRSCIQNAGAKCGLIGTIIYDTVSATSQAVLTTPDCFAIAERQSQIVKAGSKYMVIEASSHALSQNRLAGIKFKAAAFTNLAGDHLDYHKTVADYLTAKTKLFEELLPDATAVLNKQSSAAIQIAQKTKAKILWYAIDAPAALTAHIESVNINGTTFVLEYDGQRQKVKTSLPGRYNVSNHLAAAGLCLAVGFDLETITAGLSVLQTIPGRLEKIKLTAENAESAEKELKLKISAGSVSSAVKEVDFSVFIDYAHTDDALKNVLSALKPFCKAKLTVVFGCGGDRDRTKRPRMARVAEQLADFVIVTSDNPRTERPEDIIKDITVGFENPDSPTIIIEPNRKKAIELAINAAGKNDIILIAGKGHETHQIIGTQKFDFNDKAIAQECLRKRK